ncbi:differentially expressed in FDCP 8 homolog isoform X2 [Orussus abietinus]|uniref:differentially expressed in FDCP 8 homolog isoform X2 n=1 Tax=Orussus abietinus TaxID=222816 RepID=UPI000625F99C|nr:differentially expressed in FDCP 8 homolog isoform X2 [Orussus abietinus]
MAEVKVGISSSQDCPVDPRTRTSESGTMASSPSSSSDYVTGDADDSSDSKTTIPRTLKSVETLLSFSKATTQEELQEMAGKCKQLVLESTECSEERKWLVRRLIELRLRVQELRGSPDETVLETCVVLGHHLVPQKHYINSGPVYCDHCSGTIWTVLQSWYICSDCGFCCHWKCLNNICRVCVHVIASETGGYNNTMDICPEQGLSAQGYRCAECNAKITFNTAWVDPRLCDYTGLYYCQRCHWNTMAMIPARVVRNWDMEPRRVCRAAAQLLALLEERPVLQLEQLNPKLFTLIPDLLVIKKLRAELQMMKTYLVSCPKAQTQGLPWKCVLRTHLIESQDTYSLRDLADLQSGVLLSEIRTAYDSMNSHITEICKLCKARGHLCELCGNDEVIYPWGHNTISCLDCTAVHHRVCWAKRNHTCPRCARIQRRHALESEGNTESIIEKNGEEEKGKGQTSSDDRSP